MYQTYQESAITGVSWTRAKRLVIENALDLQPSVTFQEEKVVVFDGVTVTKDMGNLVEPFTEENALEEFTLKHPVTGDVVGTATYQQLQLMAYSFYLHCATKRDAAAA